MQNVARRRAWSLFSAVTAIAMLATVASCGSQSETVSRVDRSGIVIEGERTTVPPTSPTTPQPDAAEQSTVEDSTVDILSSAGSFSVTDVEALAGFKLSRTYDTEGLIGATGAIYGFFGSDPYDRREIEIRFYPDHETALNSGVDFANEATGPNAVLSSSQQRWDEGITQRRACRANTRGSHHTGRCNAAKYSDYVVLGNIIALCEGLDADASHRNCTEFADALQ